MTTLTDLTMAQLATAFGTLSGKVTGHRTFNSKATGVRRLEALLVEKSLTTADALRAAGIDVTEPTNMSAEAEPTEPVSPPCPAVNEIEADEDGCEPEQTGPYGEDDIPGSEDPPELGMVWNELEQEWQYPDEAPDTAAAVAPQADPEPDAPLPPATNEPLDAATVLASSQVSTDIQVLVFQYLTGAGLSEPEANAAAGRVGNALLLPEPTPQPQPATTRQPRTGTKQDQLIALLRRPEGATIAQMVEASGWLSHSIRGILAGAFKKKLGLTVTSTKVAGGERVYHTT